MADPARLLVDNVIALGQFERGLRSRSVALLRRSITEIVNKLLTDFKDLTPSQRARTVAMLRSFENILGRSYKEVTQLTNSELRQMAVIEGKFSSRLLNEVMRGGGISTTAVNMSAAQLKAIVEFPIHGAKLGEWWSTQGANAAFQVRRNIQLGLTQGETTAQIARRLLSQAAGREGGVMGLISRNAESLVRTSVNSISNAAKFETFSAQDPELTDSYQYTAVLDERTTIICASLDGQVFKYDDEQAPRPPQHINCRSTIVPVINWEKLGLTPADDLVQLQRASMDGPTSYQTYSGWLRDQPASVQDEVLGSTRGRLFRDGDVGLRDLVARDNTALTLDQLAHKLGVDRDEL